MCLPRSLLIANKGEQLMSVIKWLFEAQIHFGSKSILWRELIGGILGLSSAVLGMQRKVIAWPVGILGDGLLFTVFLGAVFSFGDKTQHANLRYLAICRYLDLYRYRTRYIWNESRLCGILVGLGRS